MQAAAVIVAAGRGTRFGAGGAKPYAWVAGRPLVAWTVARMAACAVLKHLVLVVNVAARDQAEAVVRGSRLSLPVRVVEGGVTRADSVAAGLRALDPGVDLVVVHDGVRPLVSPELVDAVARAAWEHGAATAGVPVRATLKRVDAARRVVRTVAREGVWEIQTPQAFRREVLTAAYAAGYERGVRMTDDAAYVEQWGGTVQVVPGSTMNVKVTVPEDLVVVEAVLRHGEGARSGVEEAPDARGHRV